jgi:hypothetical protein
VSAVAHDHERERVVLAAAAAGLLGESWPAREGLAGTDWTWILPRARELVMAARLWAELVRAGLDGTVPAAAREALQAAAQETAAHAGFLAEAARRAGAALDGAGVRWMPIKGAALALVAPEYASTRVTSDVDLVVGPDDLRRASDALAGAFPLLGEVRDYDGAERDAAAAMRDGVQHLFSYVGPGGVRIELHHALPSLTRREITETVLSRATPVQRRGASVLVPGLDDQLGVLCVHALVHHESERTWLLRHLADVSELLARGASAEVARERYDRGGRLAVATSLRELEATRLEARVRGAPPSGASRAVEPGAGGRVGGWLEGVRWHAAWIARGLGRRGLAALVPSRSFMVSLYGPPASGARLPLLHVRRWGAILLRTIKGK